MAPKSKEKRKAAIPLTKFAKDYVSNDNYDWVDDGWDANDNQRNKDEEIAARNRQENNRTANNTLGKEESFRTADILRPDTKQVKGELSPPYVAHFGNLRNGTSESEFLEMFNSAVVVTHRLISQDGKSFGFVEFSTEEALRVALSLDGSIQRARRMYVDLATPKQIERLLNRYVGTSKSGLAQNRVGQLGESSEMEFSRNVFGGQQQPESPTPPLDGGGRSTFGSRQDLTTMVELSRDILGSALTASPLDLSNWRNEEPVTQPGPQGMPERKQNNSINGLEHFSSRGNAFNEKGGLGNTAAVSIPSGNWRDEECIEAPPLPPPPPPPQEDDNAAFRKKRDGPGEMEPGRGGGRGRGRGHGRAGGFDRTTPKGAPFAENDWASFRK